MHAPFYKITAAPEQDRCVIHLSGEIDYAASLELHGLMKQLLTDQIRELHFDLEDVTLIDSEGIKVLVIALEQMQMKRGTAAITRCSSRALRIIKLAGMEQMLEVSHCTKMTH